MSMNRAILAGNVGRDAEVRTMTNGDRVASFSLATTEYWRDKATGERKDSTEWHNIVVFNQALVGLAEQYVKKGSKVIVEGMIKTRKYNDNDGNERRKTEIVISRFDGHIHLEARPNTSSDRDEHGYGTTRTRAESESSDSFGRKPYQPVEQRTPAPIDDDIPF